MSSALPSLVVNKRELARALGVSVVTVNAYIDRWPEFPVVQPGTNGKEWQFDALAVRQFLDEREAEEERLEEQRAKQIAQMGLGLEESQKDGGARMSPQERLAHVRALKAEDEIAVARGLLVPKNRVKAELTTAISRWNKALHATLRQASRDMNMPDAMMRALEDRLTSAQRRFIEDMTAEIGEDGQRSFA